MRGLINPCDGVAMATIVFEHVRIATGEERAGHVVLFFPFVLFPKGKGD